MGEKKKILKILIGVFLTSIIVCIARQQRKILLLIKI